MIFQDHELTAWLGPAYDELHAAGRYDDYVALIDDIEALYPYPERTEDDPAPEDDLTAERTAALSGALMIVLGDDTLAGIGGQVWTARRALDEATAQAKGAIIAAAAAGMPEAQIAREARLNRMTVRAALGK